MIAAALPLIRDRLQADAALRDFFRQRYPGRPVWYRIGPAPDPADGEDMDSDQFPYIALSPLVEERPRGLDVERTQRLSIRFGVWDDRIDAGVHLGMMAALDLGELIYLALADQPVTRSPAIVWDGSAQTVTDAGGQYPFFEAEILLSLKIEVR